MYERAGGLAADCEYLIPNAAFLAADMTLVVGEPRLQVTGFS